MLAPALALAAALVGSHAEDVARANQLFAAGKYAEAAEIYRRVQTDLPESPIPAVNLGAAALKDGKVDEATSAFKKAGETGDAAIRGRAAYGLGNCQAKAGDLQSALASYQRAVELLPDDEDAKWNWEWAKRKLDEQKKQQDQQKKDDQKKDDQKKDDEKKDEQKPDPQKQDDSKKEDQPKPKDEKSDEQKPQDSKSDEKDHGEKKDEPSKDQPKPDEAQPKPAKPDDPNQAKPQPQPQPGEEDPNQPKADLSQAQIERLLESLKQDEKAQRKLVKRAIPVPRGEPKKDW
jgi:Ca-activated chloride channel homolog